MRPTIDDGRNWFTPRARIGVTLEPVPLEYGEWRLVDAEGNELGRALLGTPITVRVPSSTPLFAEYPR